MGGHHLYIKMLIIKLTSFSMAPFNGSNLDTHVIKTSAKEGCREMKRETNEFGFAAMLKSSDEPNPRRIGLNPGKSD